MAMLPEVHVNLDRPAIQHIYQLFLPFVPGGTLVTGLILAHPRFSPLASATSFGRYSRITVAAFAAYIAGLMLYALSVYFGAILSAVASNLWFKIPKWRPFRNNIVISQNRVWRTVAARFLDNPLTPAPPALPGTGLLTTSVQFPQPAPPSVLQHDADWNDWYNVLQDYVLRGNYVLPADTLFVWTIIQATGWAFIFLSLHGEFGRHWSVLAVLAPIVLFSALIQFAATYTYYKFDRLTPADFTARLLVEIRAREDASRGIGSVPQTAGKQ